MCQTTFSQIEIREKGVVKLNLYTSPKSGPSRFPASPAHYELDLLQVCPPCGEARCEKALGESRGLSSEEKGV